MKTSLKKILADEIDPAFRFRANYIFNVILKSKPKRILDVGCGRGFYLRALTQLNFIKKLDGIDINDKYLSEVKKEFKKIKNVQVEKGDIYKLKFKNDCFDFIVCSEVLEHLKDDKKAILELKRVLKKNGKLVVTVPNIKFPFFLDPVNWLLMKLFNTHIKKNIWWLAGVWADHERLYEKSVLKKLFTKNGFNVVDVAEGTTRCLPFSHFLLYGIGKNLVERLGWNNFSRFNFKKKSAINQFLANMFSCPERYFGKGKERSTNTILLLQKKII